MRRNGAPSGVLLRVPLLEFLAPLEVLPYNDMAAEHYGQLRSNLEVQGTPTGSLDMLSAAHARSCNCTPVTNNIAEFSRVPHLKLDSWAARAFTLAILPVIPLEPPLIVAS